MWSFHKTNKYHFSLIFFQNLFKTMEVILNNNLVKNKMCLYYRRYEVTTEKFN